MRTPGTGAAEGAPRPRQPLPSPRSLRPLPPLPTASAPPPLAAPAPPGPFPKSLANARHLVDLVLPRHQLTGSVPRLADTLYWLDLKGNKVTGFDGACAEAAGGGAFRAAGAARQAAGSCGGSNSGAGSASGSRDRRLQTPVAARGAPPWPRGRAPANLGRRRPCAAAQATSPATCASWTCLTTGSPGRCPTSRPRASNGSTSRATASAAGCPPSLTRRQTPSPCSRSATTRSAAVRARRARAAAGPAPGRGCAGRRRQAG
jgi:hypothetical protein